MAHSWFETTRNPSTSTKLMRDAIALALDGKVPNDHRIAEAAYRAAAESLSTVLGDHLDRVRILARAGLVLAPERNEDIQTLLSALDIEPRSTTVIPDDDSWPGIVLCGCLPVIERAEDLWLRRVLHRGGIVVSADRSAELSVLAQGLRITPRQPARRTRMMLRPDLADRLIGEPHICQLVADLFSPIRLTPGHVSLDRIQECDVRVLARDVTSDDPLIVLARIGGGQVLHSVAHWFQARTPDITSVGVRPLASVPTLSDLGTTFGDAQLGGFASAVAMLTCLLNGLAVALHRAASPFFVQRSIVLSEGE